MIGKGNRPPPVVRGLGQPITKIKREREKNV